MSFALSPIPIRLLEMKLHQFENSWFSWFYTSKSSKELRHRGGILYYFWMRKTMKIMNFQSDVHSAVEVVKGWEIVQNTSNVSEEFNGRTFRYEFFRRTHPWSVQNNIWKREFPQKSDFFNFFSLDEFFQVWVLTCQNSWFWSKLTPFKT